MSELARCSTCKCQKKILGLGLIERNCDDCDGIGWVKNKVETIELESIVEPVKRKRKAKEVGLTDEA